MAAVTCELFIGCIETHANGCCHLWTFHWLYCNSYTGLQSLVDCSLVVLKLMHMAAVTCELFNGCIETHALLLVDYSLVVLKPMHMAAATCELFIGCIETRAHGCCDLWTVNWLYLTRAHGCCHLWTVHWSYLNSCTGLLSLVNCSMSVLKLMHMAAVTCGLFIGCTGPCSAVGNVSGNRCESDCRSRGRVFEPSPVPYFR